jgi:hypothetical protein
VFLVGLLALLVASIRRRRAAYLKRVAEGHFDEPEAWLEFLDGDGKHVGVTGSAFRIGRNKDNDLVLANDSVSGQHAVIHKARDGSFSVTDLKSINGVLVNLSQVTSGNLNNGDLIELGEVRFRFRAAPRAMPDHAHAASPEPAPVEIEHGLDPVTQLQPAGMTPRDEANSDGNEAVTVSPSIVPERR